MMWVLLYSGVRNVVTLRSAVAPMNANATLSSAHKTRKHPHFPRCPNFQFALTYRRRCSRWPGNSFVTVWISSSRSCFDDHNANLDIVLYFDFYYDHSWNELCTFFLGFYGLGRESFWEKWKLFSPYFSWKIDILFFRKDLAMRSNYMSISLVHKASILPSAFDTFNIVIT